MTTDEFIKHLNANKPPALQTLGGEILEFDVENKAARVRYTAGSSLCNPDGGIQGGFICGMLDAAMANAVFCLLGDVAIVATLEIKVSYLEVSRQGNLFARGAVVRSGKTITFLEAELRDAEDNLLATASSTARIIRKE